LRRKGDKRRQQKNSETVPTVPKPRQTSIKIKKEEDAREMLKETRRKVGKTQKERKGEGKKGRKHSEGFLAVRRRATEGIPRNAEEASSRSRSYL